MSLMSKLEDLGELMADNLVTMGVTDADASDGLTTLANKILNVPQGGSCIQISLTSNKSILSYADTETATLTATVTENGVAKSGESVQFYIDDVAWGSPITTNASGVATKTYNSSGSGDVTIKAECRLVSEIFSIRDVHYYNPCTSNSVEDYFTVPSAVSSRSIYGFNSDGWKFGNATSYQRIIAKESLTGWFAVEFTITELYGNNAPSLTHAIYSNGSTPNAIVVHQDGTWTIGGTSVSQSITIGDRVRIEWTSGTVKAYLNDTLLATGTHSVTLPTAVEFHTGTNRYIRIKDLIVETL